MGVSETDRGSHAMRGILSPLASYLAVSILMRGISLVVSGSHNCYNKLEKGYKK